MGITSESTSAVWVLTGDRVTPYLSLITGVEGRAAVSRPRSHTSQVNKHVVNKAQLRTRNTSL